MKKLYFLSFLQHSMLLSLMHAGRKRPRGTWRCRWKNWL